MQLAIKCSTGVVFAGNTIDIMLMRITTMTIHRYC